MGQRDQKTAALNSANVALVKLLEVEHESNYHSVASLRAALEAFMQAHEHIAHIAVYVNDACYHREARSVVSVQQACINFFANKYKPINGVLLHTNNVESVVIDDLWEAFSVTEKLKYEDSAAEEHQLSVKQLHAALAPFNANAKMLANVDQGPLRENVLNPYVGFAKVAGRLVLVLGQEVEDLFVSLSDVSSLTLLGHEQA